ncbi:MAG: site-2 protease family protein [Chloroflexi bacterium]|nr:site-2 protease family protein [Chloroflexota bacterium]
MKWAWRLGRFAGIDVYMHATFLLIIGWIALSYWLDGSSLAAVASGVGFTLLLFACVVLHEYGHALTARRYGIKTRDITLYPIGGVARLERMPDDPRQELWVALAGPAVNLVIAALLFGWLVISGEWTPLEQLSMTGGPFLERLMTTNLFLALFNLLPAFPMDGGRVLRALLAMKLDYARATQWAATLGQAIAFILGFIGLFSNPFLLFIALFVWIGAGQESGATQMRTALAGIPVGRAMLTEFHRVSSAGTLADVVALILSGTQHDFPVEDEGHGVVGVLARGTVFAALARQGQSARVADVMARNFETADSYDMLETVLPRLQASDTPLIPIMHGGQLVGLLTLENVGEFLAIQSALHAPGTLPAG